MFCFSTTCLELTIDFWDRLVQASSNHRISLCVSIAFLISIVSTSLHLNIQPIPNLRILNDITMTVNISTPTSHHLHVPKRAPKKISCCMSHIAQHDLSPVKPSAPRSNHQKGYHIKMFPFLEDLAPAPAHQPHPKLSPAHLGSQSRRSVDTVR